MIAEVKFIALELIIADISHKALMLNTDQDV